jgi:hypothetical protein
MCPESVQCREFRRVNRRDVGVGRSGCHAADLSSPGLVGGCSDPHNGVRRDGWRRDERDVRLVHR